MTKVDRFINGSQFKVEGTVKWAAVYDPDTKYEPCWKIDLNPTSEEMLEELKDAGFNVKQDKEGDEYLRVKTKVTTRDGKKNFPPTVVGRDPKVPFTEAIGNGSLCNVQIYAKYMNVAGKDFLPAYLNGVQVLDHVKFEGASGGFTDETQEVPF